ncbi:MAG: DUF4423 domain-containing protein [Bacteriovoracaceae bacterium]
MKTIETKNYAQRRIAEELGRRQKENPAYSLRAFAKFLSLQPAVVSDIINGKRPVPQKHAVHIANKLLLEPKERHLFLSTVINSKASLKNLARIVIAENEETLLNDERYYKIIAEWEHYAILSLLDLKKFKSDIAWIANRLGISKVRAEDCVSRLIDSGLIVSSDAGELSKAVAKVTTTKDISSVAIRLSHKETLQLAEKKIDEVEVGARDYSSSTIAIDPKNIPEAKELIREFRRKLSALLKDGDPSEVYQLSVQMFPLTIKEQTTNL